VTSFSLVHKKAEVLYIKTSPFSLYNNITHIMKTLLTSVKIAAFFATLSVVPYASAFTPGTTAPVTIAFTATSTTGGFKVTNSETKEVTIESVKTSEKLNPDEQVISTTTDTKFVFSTTRYGNAQLLAKMNADSLLDGEIKGWTIINVREEGDGQDGVNVINLYAVKKTKPAVPVPLEISGLNRSTATTKKEYTYTDKDDFDVTKTTESGTIKDISSYSLHGFTLQGVLNASYKLFEGKNGKGEDTIYYSLYVSGGAKVTGLTGSYGQDSAEGTISIGADKVVDLETVGYGSE
jgi:hypothetical protein